jgi:TPR repeat protein
MKFFKIITALYFCISFFEFGCAMKRPEPDEMSKDFVNLLPTDKKPKKEEAYVEFEIDFTGVDPQEQSSLLKVLPNEILVAILRKLPAKDVLAFAHTCKKVETLISDLNVDLQFSLIGCLGNDKLLKKFKSNVDPQKQSKLFQVLPKETLFAILRKLPAKDVLVFAQTCKEAEALILNCNLNVDLQLSLIDCLGNDKLLKKFKAEVKDDFQYHVLNALIAQQKNPAMLKAIISKVIEPNFLSRYRLPSDVLTTEEELWIGISKYFENDLNSAKNNFEKVCKNSLETNPWCYYLAKFFLGEMSFNANRFDEAKTIFVELCWPIVSKTNPWAYTRAIHGLAGMYLLGKGYQQDYKKAMALYKQLVNYSPSDKVCPMILLNANLNLGDIYFEGRGVEKNYQEAFKYYKVVAEYPKAQQEDLRGWLHVNAGLGLMYYSGDGVEKNKQETLKYLKVVVEHPKAQQEQLKIWLLLNTRLGLMYYSGDGVEKNEQEALKYFKVVAEHPKAQQETLNAWLEVNVRLGDIYYCGDGSKKNKQEALKCFKVVVGHPNAQQENLNAWLEAKYFYGIMYFYGQGLDKDVQKALECFTVVVNTLKASKISPVVYEESKKYIALMQKKQ